MTTIATVILAAGLGKRMQSKRVKVLHPIAGRPMIRYSIDAARKLPSDRIIVVVAHQAEAVKPILADQPVEIIHQGRPLGTGHAVLQTEPALADFRGPILILNADVPLITVETIRSMINTHRKQEADLTFLTATLSDPSGYGRVIRDSEGRVIAVVEEKDAQPHQRAVREINTGFYIVESAFLFGALRELKADNTQQEYYLTDIVTMAVRQGLKLNTAEVGCLEEIIGINNRADLVRIEKIVYRRIAERHMTEGVTLLDPDTIWIEADVVIGRDTLIYPNVRLEGASRIGEDCVIRSHTRISNCRLETGVTVNDSCVLAESVLEDGATVGPFARLRPGTMLHKGAKIGNFVETKRAELGEGSKANHLTYLGDAVIGKEVNIGAGTITCNYDGIRKHQTVIEDEVFVGSDAQFVAPVRIGRGAVIGAGSTITKDVPPDSLALSRAKQEVKKDWAKRRKKAKGKGKKETVKSGKD
ncbi:MAG: bifunctional UDP-N-acetylglucosamine diphosphorylase/glucosamine-1-phosphate N-acetyltransferase GlmU [Nitrospirae bacterium]|nr:bifunctional UDP-N-acetylglucosamine diphosphorylase/glucosamine-1-phosphate N-acetyltransferase GlmU [Nitrospirota bacterium]